MEEFDLCLKEMLKNNVNVIVLDKSESKNLDSVQIPDAVFVNWFTTYSDGTLSVFQMKFPNR